MQLKEEVYYIRKREKMTIFNKYSPDKVAYFESELIFVKYLLYNV